MPASRLQTVNGTGHVAAIPHLQEARTAQDTLVGRLELMTLFFFVLDRSPVRLL